jgi:hypothetical protein
VAASILLGYGNRIGSATITGGSWLAGAPASNVGTWPLAETARSNSALTTSTKLRINHGAAVAARVLVLARHNLSAAATVRWMRGTTAGGSDVADSGAINAWSFSPRAYDGAVYDVQLIQATQTSAQYDEIEIADTGNAAGYVELGRVFIGPAFAPAIGPSYGLRDGHSDLSTVGRAHSGAQWVAPSRRLRTAAFTLPYLSLAEGGDLHQMEQIEGLTGEVAYLPHVSKPAMRQQYGFVGLSRELSGIEYPYFRAQAKALSIEQRA